MISPPHVAPHKKVNMVRTDPHFRASFPGPSAPLPPAAINDQQSGMLQGMYYSAAKKHGLFSHKASQDPHITKIIGRFTNRTTTFFYTFHIKLTVHNPGIGNYDDLFPVVSSHHCHSFRRFKTALLKIIVTVSFASNNPAQ
jgi:hypothetical protein